MNNIMDKVKIQFDAGTLLLDAPLETELPLADIGFVYDARVQAWRGDGLLYAPLIAHLFRNGIPYEDIARKYNACRLELRGAKSPRDYQREALDAWIKAGRTGVVVLPTGTGKTFLAELAMANSGRNALVVVPTLDLMVQWARQLESAFGIKVGMLGGGSKEILPVTVSTYDSAVLMTEFIGNRFGLLVVDECHHLPSEYYSRVARGCIAPFRLGLTATPERSDGGEAQLEELLGGICFRKDIDEMEENVLAPYDTQRICVPLYPEEERAYRENHERYVAFLRRYGINVASLEGWGAFLNACARYPGGRDAMNAYYVQRKIATGSRAKLDAVWRLLCQHHESRIIVFTADNATAYAIGQRFFLPVLTHHTKAAERKEFLDMFRSGQYPCLVTSKVLNEGVDVPEADVGIVVSGSGSIREHVQRLGRILRPTPGKRAMLYEILSSGTNEWGTSDRRRQHRAYERFD